MNQTNLTYLLNNPSQIEEEHTDQLNEIIHEYPYFQSARAIQLKGLNNFNSFKYNKALKRTAAFTTDRKVLFDFITSPAFATFTSNEIIVLEDLEVFDIEIIEGLDKKITTEKSTRNNGNI